MASSSGFAYAYEPSAVAIIDGVFEGNIDLRRNCSSLQTQFNALRAAQHSHHRLPKIVDRIFEGRVIENGRIMTLKDIVVYVERLRQSNPQGLGAARARWNDELQAHGWIARKIAGNNQGQGHREAAGKGVVQAQGGGAGHGKGSASNGNSVAPLALPPTQQRHHHQQHHQQQPHALRKQGRPNAMEGLSVLCAAANALITLSSTVATPLAPPTVEKPPTCPSKNPSDAAVKTTTNNNSKVGTLLALSTTTSQPQILTTTSMTSSAPPPPRRLPSSPAPSSVPPPIPRPSVPPASTFAQQQPRQERIAAGVGIGNGNEDYTTAILAQLASLKMIAHLRREAEERQRADEARLQREAEERRRAGEERRRVEEAYRASNERLSSIVQILTHNNRVLEQEQAALQQSYATLAATHAELREEHVGQAAIFRDMQQQLQDLRSGGSRTSVEHAASSMGGAPEARIRTTHGDEKGQDNGYVGGSKKRPCSEELDAGRTKSGSIKAAPGLAAEVAVAARADRWRG